MSGLFDLSGQVAVVTGGGSGLGKGAATALSKAGASVFILGRDPARLFAAAEEIGAMALQSDVTSRGDLRQGFARVVAEQGRLDILVNAAGINLRGNSFEFAEDDWDTVHEVNTKGAFLAAIEAARLMRDTGRGKIINYCSYGSACGLPRSVAYASSKGGLRQITKSLALELAPLGIQVNGIEPGWFQTAMTGELFTDTSWVERTTARIPAGRIGNPDDLDGAVQFLASRASDYVTGIMLPVDGGAQAV